MTLGHHTSISQEHFALCYLKVINQIKLAVHGKEELPGLIHFNYPHAFALPSSSLCCNFKFGALVNHVN
eukprot:15364660-Ditylum_brightwellii.AAC.1